MIKNGAAKIEKTYDGFSISVPSKKNWFGLIIGTAWLGGWFFGLQNATTSFHFWCGSLKLLGG